MIHISTLPLASGTNATTYLNVAQISWFEGRKPRVPTSRTLRPPGVAILYGLPWKRDAK